MTIQFDEDITVSDAIDIVEDVKVWKIKQFDKFIEKLRQLEQNPTKCGASSLIYTCQDLLGEEYWYLMQDVRENIDKIDDFDDVK